MITCQHRSKVDEVDSISSNSLVKKTTINVDAVVVVAEVVELDLDLEEIEEIILMLKNMIVHRRSIVVEIIEIILVILKDHLVDKE